MKTGLNEAMASGVLVEYHDRQGNSIGQAVYLDWRGRPVPAVGDTMCCQLASPASGKPRKLLGRVQSRQFDVQTEADGAPSVWVRLVLVAVPSTRSQPRSKEHASYRARFSSN